MRAHYLSLPTRKALPSPAWQWLTITSTQADSGPPTPPARAVPMAVVERAKAMSPEDYFQNWQEFVSHLRCVPASQMRVQARA